MLDLKNCPFCGGDKVSVQHGTTSTRGQYLMVWCVSCQAAGGEHLVEAEAIAAWNRRALQAVGPEPAVAVKWEQLSEIINAAVKVAIRTGSDFHVNADKLREFARSALVATPPAEGDDWTVDDTLTAREILNYLGIGSDASLEPYADRRRDAVAKIIQKRIVATPPAEQHPDEIAVDCFAAAMKAKLKWEREQRNRSGWQAMSAADLSRILYEHLPKGDPVDVANLSMMLHQNGQQIETPPAEPVVTDAMVKAALAFAGMRTTYENREGMRAALAAKEGR